jgi:hypothetical protein
VVPVSRRCLTRILLAGGVLTLLPDELWADEQVPVRVQADLLVKVAAYDTALVARPGDRRVLLFSNPDDVDGEAAPKRMKTELGTFERIAGRAHEEDLIRYSSARALVEACNKRDAAIAYLPPGLGGKVAGIARALVGTQVLTVAARPEYVREGAVLGFDLVSGKPRLLVHLGQARKQKVDFKPELLRLAKVYR